MDLSGLKEQVARIPQIEASVKATLEFLFKEFEANKTDPAAIQELVDGFRAGLDQIVADTLANTPAAPAVPS